MRLIDADAIMKRLEYAYDGTLTVEYYDSGDPVTFEMRDPVTFEIREIKNLIMNAPTVSPWVRTADRLPTKDDANSNGDILIYDPIDEKTFSFGYKSVEKFPSSYLWWMPIPPLPEVDHVNS